MVFSQLLLLSSLLLLYLLNLCLKVSGLHGKSRLLAVDAVLIFAAL